MNNEKEIIWKEIPGYEGIYKVSNTGEVYSMSQNKIMSPSINKHGYKQVHLYKDGIATTITVHRLVAAAFIPNSNPEKFDIINHKDENKGNNHVDNLEWCDYHYNNTYGSIIERRRESVQKTWREKSAEEMNEYSKSQSEKSQAFWDSKDDEYRKQCGQKSKEIWESKSDEEKEAFRDKMSTVNKENWDNKSEESKEAFCQQMSDIWKSKSPERMKEYGDLQSKLNRERWDNKSEEQKELERERARQNGYMCSIMSQLKRNFESLCNTPFNSDNTFETECGTFLEPTSMLTMKIVDDKKVFTVNPC